MSEMVERVARAIDKAGETACEDSMPSHENMMAALALAAIAAMREPTEAMIVANRLTSWHDTVELWHAMIDEALR